MKKKHVTVIGAGIGGLSAACLFANEEFHVSVFEKNCTPGGKIQQIEKNGYRFDTGPSLLTMPFMLEKLFEHCGHKLHDFLSYSKLEPLCRYTFHNGVVFDNYLDKQKNARELERFAPENVSEYNSFLKHAEELYNRTADAFLFNPLYSLADLKNLKYFDLFGIDAFTSVSNRIDQHFSSPYLRQFFKRFTTYSGSSPYQAPATLNVIPHVELNQGGYYVHGGMYQIVSALVQLAESKSVEFHYNRTIHGIEMNKNKVSGITFKNGSTEKCDLVVANSDATDTILNLIPDTAVSESKKTKQKKVEPSCSGFVMMLGCKKKWEQLRHHNIFFSEDYEQEFIEIFEDKSLPHNPTIYIANTSYTDKNDAPDGSSNLFILINAPYVDEHHNWDEISRKYSSFIIEELEKRGLDELEHSIEVLEIITPKDFLELYRSNRGSIYGTSSNNRFAAFMRPRNKIRQIENLYLVGGSTHPGGGIPLVVQSAFNAIELMKRSE